MTEEIIQRNIYVISGEYTDGTAFEIKLVAPSYNSINEYVEDKLASPSINAVTITELPETEYIFGDLTCNINTTNHGYRATVIYNNEVDNKNDVIECWVNATSLEEATAKIKDEIGPSYINLFNIVVYKDSIIYL